MSGTVSAADVGKLRAMTGAGLMDCKKALAESGGDLDKAVDYLRKRGKQIAEKKAEREIKAGGVYASIDEAARLGVLLELGCETDFVARNDEFKALAQGLLEHVATKNPAPAEIVEQPYLKDPSRTVKDVVQALSGKIGENIQVGRFARFEAGPEGAVYSYIHFTGTVGVLLEVEGAAPGAARHAETQAIAKEICLHIAFAKPEFLSREDVPADVVAREREVYAQSDKLKGKPENMIGKIVDGMLQTFYKDRCLLEQPFVKDDKKSVAEVLKGVAGKVGGGLAIKRFALFSVGGK